MFIFFVVFVFDTIYRIRYWGYVTNKRIIKHSGVLLKEEELRIDQVESIVVERYKYVLWHQAFFSWSWGVTLKFDFISNHDEFKDAVYKAKENPNIVAKL